MGRSMERYAVSYYYCHFPLCSHVGAIEKSYETEPMSFRSALRDLRDMYYLTLEELRKRGVRIKKASLGEDHFIITWEEPGKYDCFFSGRIIRVTSS